MGLAAEDLQQIEQLIAPRVFYRKHEKSITPKNKKKQIARVFSALVDMHGIILAPLYYIGYFVFGALKILLERKF